MFSVSELNSSVGLKEMFFRIKLLTCRRYKKSVHIERYIVTKKMSGIMSCKVQRILMSVCTPLVFLTALKHLTLFLERFTVFPSMIIFLPLIWQSYCSLPLSPLSLCPHPIHCCPVFCFSFPPFTPLLQCHKTFFLHTFTHTLHLHLNINLLFVHTRTHTKRDQ